MLTEAEKKWLKQKEILDEVSEVCYTVGSCKDCYAKESCYLWPNDFRDAAEFEARVAARLTGLKAEELPCYPNKLCPFRAKQIGSCKACYIKHARLAVEQEME